MTHHKDHKYHAQQYSPRGTNIYHMGKYFKTHKTEENIPNNMFMATIKGTIAPQGLSPLRPGTQSLRVGLPVDFKFTGTDLILIKSIVTDIRKLRL